MDDQPKVSPMDHIQLALDKTTQALEPKSAPEAPAVSGPETIAELEATIANKNITIEFQRTCLQQANERAARSLVMLGRVDSFTWCGLPVGRWIMEALDRAD